MNQKRKIVREFDKRLNRLEITCANELRDFFTSLDQKIQDEVQDDGQTHMINSLINEEWPQYEDIISKYCYESYLLGKTLYTALTQPAIKARTIRIPFTVEWEVHTTTLVASEYVKTRYSSSVFRVLNEGYREGIGIVEIRKNLQRLNNNFKNYEAHRIARTEIQSHRNKATYDQMKNEGTEYKQWLTMEDELVRGNKPTDNANHVSLDMEIKRVDEPFSNGLMYPGDKNGPIEEWINCRCTSVPYVALPNEFPTM